MNRPFEYWFRSQPMFARFIGLRANATAIPVALHDDVLVVGEGHCTSRLGRAGHQHADVLAHLLEVPDEFGIEIGRAHV